MVTGKRKEVGIILGASEHFWRRRIRSLHWLWEWCHSCRQWQNLKIVHFKHMQFMICQLYLTKAIKIIQADTEKIKIENISEARRQRQKKRMPKREWASYCEKLKCHVLLRGQHRRCVIILTSENRLVKVDSYERENPRTQISWASRPPPASPCSNTCLPSLLDQSMICWYTANQQMSTTWACQM